MKSARPSSWQVRLSGLLALVLAFAIAVAVYRHPERLNAPAWVAVGPGARHFIGGLPVEGAYASLTCRMAFGLGALLLLGMLAWGVRRLLGARSM